MKRSTKVRKRSRGNASAPRSGTKDLSSAIRNVTFGRTLRPDPDPPVFVDQPWNNATIVFRFDTSVSYNRFLVDVNTLSTRLYADLGFPDVLPVGTPPFTFRLLMVRAWQENGALTGSSVLNIDVYDPLNNPANDTNADIIQTISDVGGRNHMAAVGYRYSTAAQSRTIFANRNLLGIDSGNSSDENSEVTVYYNVLWRFLVPKHSVDYLVTKSDLK